MLGDGARTVEMRVDIRWYIPSRRSKNTLLFGSLASRLLIAQDKKLLHASHRQLSTIIAQATRGCVYKGSKPGLNHPNFTLPFSHLLFVFSLFQSLNGVLSICTLFRPGVLSFFFYATLSSIHSLSRPSRLRLIYSSTLHILSKKFD